MKIFNERYSGSRSNSEVRASPALLRSPSPPTAPARHTSRKSSTEAAKTGPEQSAILSSAIKSPSATNPTENSAKATSANSTPSPAFSSQSASRPGSAKPPSATNIKQATPPRSALKPNSSAPTTNGIHTADLLGGVQSQLNQLVLDGPKAAASTNKAPVQDLLA